MTLVVYLFDRVVDILTIRVDRRIDDKIREQWNCFAAHAVKTPYQSAEWYETWLTTVGARRGESPLIISGFNGSGEQMLLIPLVLVERGLLSIGRFPGGKHANYNFPIVRHDLRLTRSAVRHIFSIVAETEPEIDIFILEALPTQWENHENCLLQLPFQIHPAASTVLALPQPISGLGSCVPLHHRSSFRKWTKLGANVIQAHTSVDVKRAMREFLNHKSGWFFGRGLSNPFSDVDISLFFENLFKQRASGAELYTLEVDQEVLAVAGLLVGGQRASLMFISYNASSRLARQGPGTHLIKVLIEQAEQRRFLEFDFGLGEAAYKFALGARAESVYTVTVPISLKGLGAAQVFKGKGVCKRWLKANPKLIGYGLSARRFLQGGSSMILPR